MKIYAFADEASPFIDGQINAMRENGIDGLEIRNVDDINIADITAEKAIEVKKKIKAAGLEIFSIGSPIGKISIEERNFERELERLRRIIELAEITEAKNIRLFSFYIPQGENPENYKNEVVERLGRYLDLARHHDVVLCHENEKGIYGATPERCLDIHRALPEMKAIFDPANFVQCGIDTLLAWDMLKAYVSYIHIKDALADGNIVPAGKGAGNILQIIKSYAACGGTAVTLEPHLMEFSGLSSLENGEKSLVGALYRYASNMQAFAAAAEALKKLMQSEDLL